MLCELGQEAEETVEHGRCNTTQQKQTAGQHKGEGRGSALCIDDCSRFLSLVTAFRWGSGCMWGGGEAACDCHVSITRIIQPRITAAVSTKSSYNLQHSVQPSLLQGRVYRPLISAVNRRRRLLPRRLMIDGPILITDDCYDDTVISLTVMNYVSFGVSVN